MKKVLMVSCEGFGNGGVQAVIMNIVRNLNDKYCFDALLFTSEKRYYDDEFLSYGGMIHRVPRYEGENLLRKRFDYYIRGNHVYRSVLKILKDYGPYDVIHCHDEFESAPIIKAASDVGVPVRIVHTHIISQKYNIVANALDNYRRNTIEKYATIKVGCSAEACKAFYKNSHNSVVVNNAYDNRRFDRRKYDVSGEKPFQLLQIGSFSSIKNQIFSVQVIECIKKKYPDIKLVLVGFPIGDYEKSLRKEIEACNLQENVIFLPSNANTPELLSNSSGFLFPSLHEGFGIVLIEAQAMGVFCYSSNNVPETTNAGGVTYLSLADGVEKWANKIISDYEQYHGAHGDFDVSEFALENVLEKYEYIYEGEIL